MTTHEFLVERFSWIGIEMFQSIINSDRSKAIVQCFDLCSALGKGENYSSFLIRAKVDYSNGDNESIHTKSFIIKVASGESRSQDVFAKEYFLYTEIIPKMQNALRTDITPLKLSPNCYKGCIKRSFLVLEDLRAENYHNANRIIGLNYQQMQLCLKTLAKWHASSVKLIDDTESTDLYDLYLKPHVRLDGSKHYRTLLENAIVGCIDTFQSNSCLQSIRRKLGVLKTNVFEKCCEAVQRNDDAFNVLTHGDLWSNNIMFKDDSSVECPLFLDFQMSFFGSPILDVSYLLFTSLSESIEPKDFDSLFAFYCDELLSVLQTIDLHNIAIPTKDHLCKAFAAKSRYSAIFSLFSVPIRVLENAKNDEVKRFLDDSEDGHTFRHQIYSNPLAQRLLKTLLLYFNEKLFLE